MAEPNTHQAANASGAPTLLFLLIVSLCTQGGFSIAAETNRVAPEQPKRFTVDWHERNPVAVLTWIDQSLEDLDFLVESAAAQNSNVVVFPEAQDVRARLFRERNPAAFPVRVDTNPPISEKLLQGTPEELTRVSERVLTPGEEAFRAANQLARQDRKDAAIREFARLQREYRDSRIDQEADRRLAALTTEAESENTTAVATKYPGDAGIERSGAVIFSEDFEGSTLEDLKKRWDAIKDMENMSFSDDVPTGSLGKHSLLITHTGGHGTGGHLYRRLLPGYNKLYLRFYVKFDPGCAPIHHFLHLGGHNPPTPYPQGGAGERPKGDADFSVGIEPFGKAWTWDYYAYWMDMRGSPPRGQTWGNSFIRDPKLSAERGKWTCLETMIRLNQTNQYDGELALWIDGREVSHLGKGFPKGKWVFDTFRPGEGGESIRWDDNKAGAERSVVPQGGSPFEGFRWRADSRLNLNYLWLLLYITDAAPGQVSRVWLANIVVATQYIGPIQH